MVGAPPAGTAVTRRATALALFLGTAAAFIHCAAPGATPGDAGEFIAAAGTLSIPHSPSFPLYVLLAHAFISLVPFGSIAIRVALFSSVCGAGAVTLIFLTVDTASERRWPSVLCALAAGAAAPFWLNALVAEVFALHAMLVVGFLYIVALAARGRVDIERAAVLFGFIGGVAAANHQTVLFVAPAYAAFFLLCASRSRLLRATLLAGLFALAGLTIFLVLPIRSAKNPPLDWGHPVTAERLYRTIMRKDYGTLSLALGGTPDRTVRNTARQTVRFSRRVAREAGWPLVVAGLLGLGLGIQRRDGVAAAALAILIFSGPVFFLMGNLPFDAQSDGITLRFYIAPVIALAIGTAALIGARPKLAGILLAAGLLLGVAGGRAEAFSHRHHMLVPDFASSLIRAVPKDGALFLDGGDDAFYGIATEIYTKGRRPDLAVHDRGGLVFPSPYGSDFRSLTFEEKIPRRALVEKGFAERGPLYYSTMNRKILPGAFLAQRGLVYETNGRGAGFDWPLVCVRLINPCGTCDYRTRALAAFIPYMRGLSLLERSPEQALREFRRATFEAPDVTWLRVNLSETYAEAGTLWLQANRIDLARRAYSDWIEFDGGTEVALNNLGVVSEKEGKADEAARWYKMAAERFPSAADPVFNLGVMAWKRGDWNAAAINFSEVIHRKPDHGPARAFLGEAQRRLAVRK